LDHALSAPTYARIDDRTPKLKLARSIKQTTMPANIQTMAKGELLRGAAARCGDETLLRKTGCKLFYAKPLVRTGGAWRMAHGACAVADSVESTWVIVRAYLARSNGGVS